MTASRVRAVRLAVVFCALAGASVAQGPAVTGGSCQRAAGLESLGLATAGAHGLLELAVEGAPVAGLPFYLTVRNGVPGQDGIAVFGAKPSPLVLPAFGATVFPSLPFVLELPFTFDAHGASPPLFEQMPVDAALCGTAYVAQAAAIDPAAMGGVSFSKAVGLRFGTAAGEALFGPGGPGYPITQNVQDAEVGDLNADQHLDVAFAAHVHGGLDEAVVVLFGAGDGTLGPAQVLPTGNNFPGRMAVGDVDGDGTHDLVASAANVYTPGTGVQVLLSDGAGGFLPPTLVGPEPNSADVVVADMNADGQPDLVYTRQNVLCDCDDVRVLLGTGGGAFLALPTAPVDAAPIALSVVDMDQDGVLDVATANRDLDGFETPGSVSVLIGLGDGAFQQHQTLLTQTPDVPANMAIWIESADFALDGFADLAALVTYSDQGSVSLFRGVGGGAFLDVANHPAGSQPWDLGVADVDRDLHPDVILATLDGSEGVRILHGTGNGTLSPYVAYDLGYNAWSLASGDFNGDFQPDLVVGREVENLAVVVLNQLLP